MSDHQTDHSNSQTGNAPSIFGFFNFSSILVLVGLIISIPAISSCGGSEGDIEKPSAGEVGEPPSVSGEQAGRTLVKLNEREVNELNIQTEQVGQGNFNFEFSAPGQVEPAPNYVASVSAPLNGRVAKIYAQEGQTIEEGELLLELESLEYADMLASYMEAKAEVRYQQQQQQRISKLVDQNISPQRELEKVQADLSRARVQVRASLSRLQSLGLSRSLLENLDIEQEEQPLLQIRAPISGRINEHMVELGQSVNAYEKMMDIIDNRKVRVRGFLSPEDAPMVRKGDEVTISSRKNDARTVTGEISSINPALDRENKSISVNILVDTQNQWPVIGQSVRLVFSGRTPNAVTSVPLNAIQYEGKQATVFVKRDEQTFEKRYVKLRQITEESAILASGLQPGEEVAVTQVFSLKAKEKFEEFAD